MQGGLVPAMDELIAKNAALVSSTFKELLGWFTCLRRCVLHEWNHWSWSTTPRNPGISKCVLEITLLVDIHMKEDKLIIGSVVYVNMYC